jgi:uncharacterized protein YjbI with pentapeptide repeats
VSCTGATKDAREPRRSAGPDPRTRICGEAPRTNEKGKEISDKRIGKEDWECARFTDSVLRAVEFTRTTLSLADFTNADLSAVTFTDANLGSAVFRNARLKNVHFVRANLYGAIFADSSLELVQFSETVCPDGEITAKAGEDCRGHGI